MNRQNSRHIVKEYRTYEQEESKNFGYFIIVKKNSEER